MQAGQPTSGLDAAIALSGTDALDDLAYADLARSLHDGDETLVGHVRALTAAVDRGDRVPQRANLDLLAAYEKLERLGRPLRAVVQPLPAPKRAIDGPLLGTPVAIKDMIDIAGCVRGDGNPSALGEASADHDAPVIERLRAAAADVFTTATLLEYAAGAPHPDLPEALNPVRPDRTAGGSSGGSAALVGAGVCPAALGTDTGGSIRLPAHYVGVVGIKPTHGLVPLTGITPLSPSLDHCGVLAADVQTAARVLAVIADRPDIAVAAAAAQGRGLDGLRIGILTSQLAHQALNEGLRSRTRSAIQRFAAAGATIREVDDAVLTELGDLLVPILLPEAWLVHGERVASEPGWYGPETLRLFQAAGQSDPADREKALARRAELLPVAEALLDDVDVLLGPAAPYVAPEKTPPIDTPEGEIEGLFTGPFNVTGQPAVVLPAGRTDDGLPFAIQLAGRIGADGDLLAVAARLEATLR